MTTTKTITLQQTRDGDAYLNLKGISIEIRMRMTNDPNGSGWVSWDSHARKLVLELVRELRLAGMTADEAQDNDSWNKAFLYVGGEA